MLFCLLPHAVYVNQTGKRTFKWRSKYKTTNCCVVNVLFHLTVIELSEFTSRPSAASVTGLRARRTLTLRWHAHYLTSTQQVLACLWNTEHDRSPSCGRLPAGGIRRAAPRPSQASQGLAQSNLGRDPTMGYDDDWMRGGCNHDASTLNRELAVQETV